MDLLGIAIALGVVLAFVLVGGLIATFTGFMRARLKQEDMELLDRVALMAVWAVEQLGSGVFTNKKAAAKEIIGDQLQKQGKLDVFAPTMIDAAVEANVAQAFNYRRHQSGTDE